MDITRPIAPAPYDLLPAVPSFTVVSNDVQTGQQLPPPQTEDGGSTSPHLRWEGFPEQTQSFMVSCYDPDAPGPAGWWHWTVVNLPATVTELPTDAGNSAAANLPAGAFHLRNDSGTVGYAGSAPPPGDHVHRYFFAIHALDVADLGATADTMPGAAGCMATFHTLARALIVPTAQR